MRTSLPVSGSSEEKLEGKPAINSALFLCVLVFLSLPLPPLTVIYLIDTAASLSPLCPFGLLLVLGGVLFFLDKPHCVHPPRNKS